MGVSLYTALVIQSVDNDIRCEIYGSDGKGKYAGAINLYHDGHLHTTLLSTGLIYGSEKDAIEGMEGVVKQVRAINLAPKKKEVEEVIAPTT